MFNNGIILRLFFWDAYLSVWRDDFSDFLYDWLVNFMNQCMWFIVWVWFLIWAAHAVMLLLDVDWARLWLKVDVDWSHSTWHINVCWLRISATVYWNHIDLVLLMKWVVSLIIHSVPIQCITYVWIDCCFNRVVTLLWMNNKKNVISFIILPFTLNHV